MAHRIISQQRPTPLPGTAPFGPRSPGLFPQPSSVGGGGLRQLRQAGTLNAPSTQRPSPSSRGGLLPSPSSAADHAHSGPLGGLGGGGGASPAHEEQHRQDRLSEAGVRSSEIANQGALADQGFRRREEGRGVANTLFERNREAQERDRQQRNLEFERNRQASAERAIFGLGQQRFGLDERRFGLEKSQAEGSSRRADAASEALLAELGGGAGGGERLVLPSVDNSAADAARFGAAKEQIGDVTQGSLTALEDIIARSGFAEAPAGGAETAVQGNIIRGGAQGLTDVTRAQTIEGAQRQERTNALQFQADTNRQQRQQQQRLALQELLSRGLF